MLDDHSSLQACVSLVLGHSRGPQHCSSLFNRSSITPPLAIAFSATSVHLATPVQLATAVHLTTWIVSLATWTVFSAMPLHLAAWAICLATMLLLAASATVAMLSTAHQALRSKVQMVCNTPSHTAPRMDLKGGVRNAAIMCSFDSLHVQ